MSEPIQFDPPDLSELSKLLAGYEVTSLIATGGMGAVYKATQVSLDRDVAIKLLPVEFGEDPSFRDQFEAEARSMAKLNHANLIGIYDFGEADGMPFIVMELVAGKSLYHSSYGKAIDEATAVQLIIGICRGLAHAHDANIIHRDIKPANILLDPNAKPKIGDFGLAAASDSEHSEDGPIFGTPGYVAPEIFSNPKAIGVQSDIYAVGVILYELLTGKMPEEPASPPSSIAKCDRRLDPIFKKATRRNPALRFKSADEMADDLEKILPNIGASGQKAVRTAADRKAPATMLKRRMTHDTNSGGKESGKPQLVPLAKGEGASGSRLKPLPKSSPEIENDRRPAPVESVAPAAVSVQAGSNWPIIRNLIIIAVLIPVIIFTWGLYQKKQDRIKKELDAKELKEKNNEIERKAQIEQAKRDEEKKVLLAEEKKALEAQLEKERQRLLAIENARTPMDRLAEYRTALFNGRRDRFPDNTIDRSSHFLFFVNTPMTWTKASEFAEMHGAHLALGVMVVAGIIQILMGVFKWGKFVDIFPLSAVHGMLAAIGFIIIAKQVPVLLNVDPSLAAGKGPLALFAAIPSFFANLDSQVSIIGGVSLAIMLGWGFVKHPLLKKIPAPLLVLIFAVPASLMMNLGAEAPDYTLVKVGKIIDQVGINASAEGYSQTGIFIKFVIMVSLVGTLESLLTVKAIDMLDPWKRKADPNKDIIAIGVSNSLAGLLGGNCDWNE
ncbi:protein kinase [Akkermansiaceae bacterium]|nr:protein kinase [Akkermansiaceae bacterium]